MTGSSMPAGLGCDRRSSASLFQLRSLLHSPTPTHVRLRVRPPHEDEGCVVSPCCGCLCLVDAEVPILAAVADAPVTRPLRRETLRVRVPDDALKRALPGPAPAREQCTICIQMEVPRARPSVVPRHIVLKEAPSYCWPLCPELPSAAPLPQPQLLLLLQPLSNWHRHWSTSVSYVLRDGPGLGLQHIRISNQTMYGCMTEAPGLGVGHSVSECQCAVAVHCCSRGSLLQGQKPVECGFTVCHLMDMRRQCVCTHAEPLTALTQTHVRSASNQKSDLRHSV